MGTRVNGIEREWARRSVKQPAVQAGRNEEHVRGSTGMDRTGEHVDWRA